MWNPEPQDWHKAGLHLGCPGVSAQPPEADSTHHVGSPCGEESPAVDTGPLKSIQINHVHLTAGRPLPLASAEGARPLRCGQCPRGVNLLCWVTSDAASSWPCLPFSSRTPGLQVGHVLSRRLPRPLALHGGIRRGHRRAAGGHQLRSGIPWPPPEPGPLPVVESGSRKLPGSSFPWRPTLTPSPTVNPTPDSQLDVGTSPERPPPNAYCRLTQRQAHLHRPLSSYNRPASQQSPCVQGRKGSERLRASPQDTQASQWGRGPSLQSHPALGVGVDSPASSNTCLRGQMPRVFRRCRPPLPRPLPAPTPPQTPPRPPPQPPLGSFHSCGAERNRPRNKQTGRQAPAQSRCGQGLGWGGSEVPADLALRPQSTDSSSVNWAARHFRHPRF